MKPLFRVAIFALLMFFGVTGPLLHGQVVIDNNLIVLLTEDFTGGLGTGAGEVTWAGSGGFAAVGGDHVVQIGGSPTEINWAAPNFIGNGRTLILGDPNADGTLIWDKAINLGAVSRRIRVLHGSGNAGRADARVDKALRGSSLIIEGNGRLDITGNNPGLTRTITVEGAELRLNGTGRLSAIRSILVYRGGHFVIDNAGTSNAATGGQYIRNRLSGAATDVRLEAGTFRYIGQTGVGNSIESFDRIDFYAGSNTIEIIDNRAGSFSELQLNRLRGITPSATMNFIGTAGISGFGDAVRLRLTNTLTLTGDIYPSATVKGVDWVTVIPAARGQGHMIVSYWDYNREAQETWDSIAINASPTADQVLSADRTINSLRLTGGQQVNLAGMALLINAGALLSSGATNNEITGGLLNLSVLAYAHIYNTGGTGLTISSAIQGGIFTKTGPGSLTLSGTTANALGSGFYVNEGVLILNKSAGVAAISSQARSRLSIGDRGHSAIVRLDNSEQIANGAELWLRGGFADLTRHVGWGAEGILQFNGAGGVGITETFRNLVVEGSGVVDFQGGILVTPNRLILDDLRVLYGIEGGSMLLVRNWVDFEDRLLVKRSSVNLTASLPHIHFEGYAPGAALRDYDAQFWEVVPAPEPSTCGAILGALGLGLWGHQRRKSCKRYPQEAAGFPLSGARYWVLIRSHALCLRCSFRCLFSRSCPCLDVFSHGRDRPSRAR